LESDPNAYIYVITQAAAFNDLAKAMGREDWVTDPQWNTPAARLDKLDEMFAEIEKWTMTMSKYEVMDILNPLNVPCGPILSMKELAEEPALRATGTIAEVDHPTRGKYLTIGNPIKLSDSPVDMQRSPLLGEHTEEILRSVLGFGDEEVEAARAAGAVGSEDRAATA
jgi:formyl-CoA transferase